MAKVGRPKGVKGGETVSPVSQIPIPQPEIVDLTEMGDTPPSNPIPISSSTADLVAEEMKKARKLPTIPSRELLFKDYVEWSKLLTKDHWEHILTYVYRTYPIIIRQQSSKDNPSYIDKVAGKLTREDIVGRYGGGKYDLYLNDTDQTKNPQLIVRVDIPLHEADPILNYTELDLGRKENGAYVTSLIQKGLIDESGKIMTPESKANQATEANANAMMGMVREFMGIIKTLNQEQTANLRKQLGGDNEGGLGKSIGDILLEQMKQQDPNKQLQTFTTLLNAVKPNESKAADNQVSLIKELFEAQKQANAQMFEFFKMQMEMMKGSQTSSNDKSSDTTDELDKLSRLLAFAREIRGGGGHGAERSGWDVAVDVAREVASPLLTALGNLFAMKMQNPMQAPMQMGNQPNPSNQVNLNVKQLPVGGVGVVSNPSNLPNSVNSSNQVNQPNPSNQPNLVGSEITPEIQQLIPLIHQYGNLIITNGLQAKKGYEFAEDLIAMMGNAPYLMVAKYGEDTLIQAMKAVPEFWNTVDVAFGEHYVKQWVSDFIHYEERIAELEEQEEIDSSGSSREEDNNTIKIPSNIQSTGKGKKGKVSN